MKKSRIRAALAKMNPEYADLRRRVRRLGNALRSLDEQSRRSVALKAEPFMVRIECLNRLVVEEESWS